MFKEYHILEEEMIFYKVLENEIEFVIARMHDDESWTVSNFFIDESDIEDYEEYDKDNVDEVMVLDIVADNYRDFVDDYSDEEFMFKTAAMQFIEEHTNLDLTDCYEAVSVEQVKDYIVEHYNTFNMESEELLEIVLDFCSKQEEPMKAFVDFFPFLESEDETMFYNMDIMWN